jgi:RHS repeat-associated protein
LAENIAGNGVQFVAYDGNGNVSALVNAANGATVANYEYGPFGEVIRATGPMAKVNPFRFSTKYEDDETDLLYYGYRYYNPSTGRWLSRDPIGEKGGKNLYAFCNNAPTYQIDALGKISVLQENLTTGNCGQFSVQWIFFLDNPAPADGYIVQQINVHWNYVSCSGAKTDDIAYYWEAIPVKAGYRVGTGGIDTWSSPAHPNTVGNLTMTGQAEFFVNVSISGWEPGSVWPQGNWPFGPTVTSGSFPSTDVPPSFWNNNPIEQGANRTLSDNWACCCPYNPHTTVGFQ